MRRESLDQHCMTEDDGNERDEHRITNRTEETGHDDITIRRDRRGAVKTQQARNQATRRIEPKA